MIIHRECIDNKFIGGICNSLPKHIIVDVDLYIFKRVLVHNILWYLVSRTKTIQVILLKNNFG